MSAVGDASQQLAGQVVAYGRDHPATPDPGAKIQWARRHAILLAGLGLIAIQLAWRAQFLGQLFYRQDDFYNLDLAISAPFNWSYLTFIGAGHLMIGPRAITWMLARASLYNWAPAATVILVFIAASSLAALRLLRTLFGERPAILVPLAVYLLCPLTLPATGWWSAAIETIPLQLAVFMALNAHVTYVRSGRLRHVAAASGWIAFGLLFFVKALVLPPLLFAITAAFFAGGGSWLDGIKIAARRHWKAWLPYAVLLAGYGAVLTTALRTAATPLQLPTSAGAVVTFGSVLMWRTFIPGALGGPWLWSGPGGSYALANTPTVMSWLAVLIAAAVVAGSILLWRPAWRSWAILAGWLVMADMLPVIAARFNFLPPVIFGDETRYVADAVPILAICVGLAVIPLVAPQGESASTSRRTPRLSRRLRKAVGVLAGILAVSSIWSAQAYQGDVSAQAAASYIANAALAIRQAPRGTPVINTAVPGTVLNGLFGKNANASRIVGDLERGHLAGKLIWVRRPEGTLDNLMMLGADGRLRLAAVYGAASPRLRPQHGCWPARDGHIAIPFGSASPGFTSILRIGYLWFAATPGVISVQYGSEISRLTVRYGLNAGYLQVAGSATQVTVTGFPRHVLCVGDVEAGYFGQALGGPVIPPMP
jgi:hypothetical protein